MNIVFVCSGNAARSVMAEALFKKMLEENGVRGVSAHSCGTRSSPLYRAPPAVHKFLAARGADASLHRPVQIDRDMADAADLLLVMEKHQRDYIVSNFPEARDSTFLLKEYVHAQGDPEIPDPIGGPDEAYAETGREIAGCLETLMRMIRKK
ncbi:MAG: arsenate reductase/protein-tyrosine-phosphatase family protein [Endomicrobiales bacterium]